MKKRFTVKKENGKLFFNDLGGYETRNPSTIWLIENANKVYNWKDFSEITIHTDDKEINIDDYTYSKQDCFDNLVPDFNFHSWPQVGINDYEDILKQIDDAGKTPHLINKVGWIGNKFTNVMRQKMIEIGNDNKSLFDFFPMEWSGFGQLKLTSSKFISMPDLVKTYSILIDIEGHGYSGRLKHLLWSHRPLLLVDRPHKEYFFKDLNEWDHYIPVRGDLSDLLEKTHWVMNNYDKACIIAENAFEFSKIHLTREACYKQWDLIITDFMSKSVV